MKIELELHVRENPYAYNATVRSVNEPTDFSLIKEVVDEILYRLPLKIGNYEVTIEATYSNSKEVLVETLSLLRIKI